MLKNIIKVLTIILTILVLVCKAISNIKIKKEIQKVNEKYITNNEETGVIEYKSDTLHIKIILIKKTNPNIEM